MKWLFDFSSFNWDQWLILQNIYDRNLQPKQNKLQVTLYTLHASMLADLVTVITLVCQSFIASPLMSIL